MAEDDLDEYIRLFSECSNCGNIGASGTHCFVCCLVENCADCAYIEAEIKEMMADETEGNFPPPDLENSGEW